MSLMKKIIAFDLDGTLAPSKSHFAPRMVTLFNRLLQTYQVCVISGGKYQLFQQQFLTQITDDGTLLEKLHLMPTSGTRYYRYKKGRWQLIYAEDFTQQEKAKIISALQSGLDESGLRPEKIYGELIEDRDSQITLSLLGQDIVAQLGEEGVRIKEAWDPDDTKKQNIRDIIARKIPDFNVRVAGATSIDITKPGIDKAYGISKLLKMTGYDKEDILFFGDKIFPGGNDYAVKELGVECVSVANWIETADNIESLLSSQ
jgi:phosphomannomutase